MAFSPTSCNLTSVGVPLTRKGYVTFELKEATSNDTPAVVRINLGSAGSGHFTASNNSSDFTLKGNIQLNNYTVVKVLTDGSIDIENTPRNNSLTNITFDLTFEGGIHIKGSGKVLFHELAGA